MQYGRNEKMRGKKIGIQFLLLLFLTAGTAFSQTLALKADIGVCACWDAVGLNMYEVYGIKVGTFSMIMHIVCVLVQLAVQRKTFNIWKFLQIPYVIIFGSFLNFFYYDVLTFELHSYVVKFAFVILAYLGLALFLGPLLLLNLVNMPSEAMCVVLSGKYEIDYAKIRVGLDAVCIAASLVLSFFRRRIFKGPGRNYRWNAYAWSFRESQHEFLPPLYKEAERGREGVGSRHMPMISYSLIQASLYSLYEILPHGLIVLKKIQFFIKKPCKYV